jgi:hypothetical protein
MEIGASKTIKQRDIRLVTTRESQARFHSSETTDHQEARLETDRQLIQKITHTYLNLIPLHC